MWKAFHTVDACKPAKPAHSVFRKPLGKKEQGCQSRKSTRRAINPFILDRNCFYIYRKPFGCISSQLCQFLDVMEPGKHVHTFFLKFIVLVRERDGPQVYSKLARRLCTSTCMLAQYLGSVVLLYVGRTLCWSSSTIVGHLTDTNTFWT